MRFALSISLGNEVMQTQADVRDAIVRTFSMEAEGITLQQGDDQSIYDRNGNRVGMWHVTVFDY